MLMLWLLAACASPTAPDGGLALPSAPTWPARNAPLHAPEVVIPPGFGVKRIAIDPGHGTGENTGTRTVWCEDEADVVLALAEDLAARLEATGAFEVMLTRHGPNGPSYHARLRAVTAFRADALLSLHLDARGASAWQWSPEPGLSCWRNDAEAGFAVLVADRGAPPLVAGRLDLARSIALEMTDAGFLPYSGADYGGLYAPDATAGVFRDRRVLFMLRRPAMPSVIIETMQGLDEEERERWDDERTRQAFARAVEAALVAALAP